MLFHGSSFLCFSVFFLLLAVSFEMVGIMNRKVKSEIQYERLRYEKIIEDEKKKNMEIMNEYL